MDDARCDALWNLYRTYRTGVAPFAPIDATLIAPEHSDAPPLFRVSGAAPSTDGAVAGVVQGYEAHGGRSVWIHRPWRDPGGTYPGYEYKGAGNFDGTPPYLQTSGPYEIIVGGQRLDWATEEFDTTRRVQQAGADVQRAIAVFQVPPPFDGMHAGIFVRATRSPIRLMHFWRHPEVLTHYLAIGSERIEAYAARLGAAMGRSARLMLSLGIATPLHIDNVTSEGEFVDFEHVWNGWYYGHPMPPSYVFETVYAAFREMPFVFGAAVGAYDAAFTRELCGTAVEMRGDAGERSRAAVARFLGAEVDEPALIAPVADGVRVKLLEDWDRALTFYRYLEAQRSGLSAVAGTTFVLDNLTSLIRMTEDDIRRMRARPAKVLTS